MTKAALSVTGCGSSPGSAEGGGDTPSGKGKGLEKKNETGTPGDASGTGGGQVGEGLGGGLVGSDVVTVETDATSAGDSACEIVKLNPYRYAGYRYDVETELYFLETRYYDSWSNRFVSRDSYRGEVEQPLTLNRYVYALNAGPNFADPNGSIALPRFPDYQSFLTLDWSVRMRLVQTMLARCGYSISVTGQQGVETDQVLTEVVTRGDLRLVRSGDHVFITPELYSLIQRLYASTLLRQAQPNERIGHYDLAFRQPSEPPPFEAGNGFIWPTTHRDGVITDPFHLGPCQSINPETGEYERLKYHEDGHHGIDVGGRDLRGTPVLAVRDGTLLPDDSREESPPDKNLTLYVTLAHDYPSGEKTLLTRYKHMDWVVPFQAFPKENDEIEVSAGRMLGVVGSTGPATGPHLHFEVYDRRGSGSSAWVDPLLPLDPRSLTPPSDFRFWCPYCSWRYVLTSYESLLLHTTSPPPPLGTGCPNKASCLAGT